ncbi:MAG: hypothetical protein ACFFDT_18120 [Candidatus Hodarchaeota archaeon]
MKLSDCERLVEEADEASKHSIEIAADIFEDAAKCFDGKGERQKAAQFLTLAGDFLLDLNMVDKAATCYGKAIVRYLMAENLEMAQLLLEKGKEYGFSSSTHQFRIAHDALERWEKEEIKEEIRRKKESLVVEALPDIEIMPIEEGKELESLITIDTDMFNPDDEIQVKKEDYIVPQLDTDETSKFSSFAVLAAVSQSTRKRKEPEIHSNAIVKDKAGSSRFIQPTQVLTPIGATENSDDLIRDPSDPKELSHKIIEKDFRKDEEIISDVLTRNDTLDLDYAAKTEIINEYEEELIDIEIIDTIPFQWQVVDVKSDFELDERRSTSEGLVFTWRKGKIDPGSKVSVEYVLRKRIERSIILRKENQVSVVSLYHSIKQYLQEQLDFVNTSGEVFREVLIEDIIPPELIVKEARSPQEIKPVFIPTHDSTLYRWIFSNLVPGDSFSVNYKFREKPLTRYYIDEIEVDGKVIKIEKISQPLIDSYQYDYIWMYSINNQVLEDFTLFDRIPADFDLILVDPIHLRPSVTIDNLQKLLSWQISSEVQFISIIIRIRGTESFTPIAPLIKFSNIEGEVQLKEQDITSEKCLIDIRRLIKDQKEND